MQNQLSIDEIRVIYSTFDRDFDSLVLSTVSPEGFPHVSYAPYVKDNENYYVIVSENAEHYDNLIDNLKVSVMFIQDELSTGNVFFRNRLSFKCNASITTSEEIEKKFSEKHGELIDMLLHKMDFHVFELTPFIGKIVLGPGRAFIIEGEEITHDRGKQSHMKE